jgi:hypothetical protein
MSQIKTTILDSNGNQFVLDRQEIAEAGNQSWASADSITISQSMMADSRQVATRQEIYGNYSYMSGSPIIATALNLHVTQSLGAHENTSDVFFLEAKPDASAEEMKILDELRERLSPKLNSMAYEIAYNATVYGDAYARIYSKPKEGIKEIVHNDDFNTPNIIPMERCGQTVGYLVALEKDASGLIPMTNKQIARFKLQRMGSVPQQRMLYNSWMTNACEDDPDKHMPLPGLIGGSFLQDAGPAFYMLQNALFGLNSSRILDSVRESMVSANMANMNKEQQDKFINNLMKILKASANYVSEAVKTGQPISRRFTHIMPVFDEKQLVQVDNSLSGSGNASVYTLDDVMFYARSLAAVLGHDLSMLGFSDQLSGGLGDGGFYRVSAQGALRSIMLRMGFTDFVNHCIDVHMHLKYGGTFYKRPYQVTYIGAQTAMEKEKQDVQERRSMSAGNVLSVLRELKEQGFSEKSMINFMKDNLQMDEDDAILYAADLIQSREELNDEDDEDNTFQRKQGNRYE